VTVSTRSLVVLLLIGLAPRSASAHHYFASTFDSTRAIRLTGVLTRAEWKNPHSHLYLDVKDKNGRVEGWACEAGPPTALARHGWTHGSVRVGETVVVEGFLAKDGSRSVVVRRISLPGGRVVMDVETEATLP